MDNIIRREQRLTRLREDIYLEYLVNISAGRSTCRRRGVSAIGLDQYRRVIGIGFNGVPSGEAHCTDHPCLGANGGAGDTSACLAVHAEQNLIVNSAQTDNIVELWASATPCKACAQLLCGLPNLRRGVFLTRYSDSLGYEIIRKKLDILVVKGEDMFHRGGDDYGLAHYMETKKYSLRDLLSEST